VILNPDKEPDLVQRLHDWNITTRTLNRYPPHIGKWAVPTITELRRQGKLKLPRDPDGVRLRLELAAGAVSRHSLAVVCGLLTTN